MGPAMSLIEHLMPSAEHELGAFIGAISELFGADHAQRAADDWLAELERAELSSIDTVPEVILGFRAVTIAAAVRFAAWLNTHDGLPGRCMLDASDEIAEPTHDFAKPESVVPLRTPVRVDAASAKRRYTS